MLWVITGYSSNRDGFLYVVKAKDKEEAIASIPQATRGGNKVFHVPTEDDTIETIIAHKSCSLEDLREAFEIGNVTGWVVYSQELMVGVDHPEAVCW